MSIETIQQPVIRRTRLNQGQGLVEYSLIIVLVAVICVSILVVLGRGTKSAIQKVTCTVGSNDPQCSCTNEKLSATSEFPNGCSGTTLIITVDSTCPSAVLSVNSVSQNNPGNFSWPNSPVCTGDAMTFVVQSTHPDGSVKNYEASRP
jgi:Flp pilus assembly pilin Flp